MDILRLSRYITENIIGAKTIRINTEVVKALNELKSELWLTSYPTDTKKVNIDIPKTKKTPGENRQIASDEAEYDYIIYQDADDLPHIQRIEIMNYVLKEII